MEDLDFKLTIKSVKDQVEEDESLILLEYGFYKILLDNLAKDTMEDFLTCKSPDDYYTLPNKSERYRFFINREYNKDSIYYVLSAHNKLEFGVKYDICYIELFDDGYTLDSYINETDGSYKLYKDIYDEYMKGAPTKRRRK